MKSVDSSLSSFIKEWLGTPYRWGGKTKNGIDCSQFNKVLYKKVYSLDLTNTCKEQYTETKRIKFSDLLEGDLLFFNSPSSPSKWHCGVYLGNMKFVHSSSTKNGVKISDFSESTYKKRFKSGGRIF